MKSGGGDKRRRKRPEMKACGGGGNIVAYINGGVAKMASLNKWRNQSIIDDISNQ